MTSNEAEQVITDAINSVASTERPRLAAIALINAFTWGDTEEGCTYWDNIYNTLLRMSKNQVPIYRDIERGYELVVDNRNSGVRFIAGCRNFSAEEALEHWGIDRPQPMYVAAIKRWLVENGHPISEYAKTGT